MKYCKTLIIIVLSLVFVLLLASCSKNDNIETNSDKTSESSEITDTQDANNPDTTFDPTASGFFNIKADDLPKIAKANYNITDNFIVTSDYRRVLKNEEDKYSFYKVISIDCERADSCKFEDENVGMSITMNYAGDRLYPSEIITNVRYNKLDTRNEVDKIYYEIIGKLINDSVVDKIKLITNGESNKEVYSTKEVTVYTTKSTQDLTADLGYDIETIRLDIIQNDDRDYNNYVDSYDSFDPVENQSLGLYNLAIYEYGTSAMDCARKIARIYSDLHVGQLVSISESKHTDDTGRLEMSTVSVNVFKNESSNEYIPFKATIYVKYNEDRERTIDYDFKIEGSTFEYDVISDCYQATEIILETLTGKEVALDGYLDVGRIEPKSFEVVIDSDNMVGYPAIGKFDLVIANDMNTCHMDYKIETIKNSGANNET